MIESRTEIVVDADSILSEYRSRVGEVPYNLDIGDLFWRGDFMNDSYKCLGISEYEDETPSEYDDEIDIKEINYRNEMRAMLRECFPNVDYLLVDVSW